MGREEAMKNIIILLIGSLLCSAPKISSSCTTFCLDKGGHLVFGKNFGWIQNDGLVFVNKRGVVKTARSGGEVCSPASWTSQIW